MSLSETRKCRRRIPTNLYLFGAGDMLLLRARFRKWRLHHALVDYPQYDPPHKAEERVLPRQAALENFEYFMATRLKRTRYLAMWLDRNFGVDLSSDLKGVQALGKWGNKYAGLLPVEIPSDLSISVPFFTYSPTWTGDYAGYNVIFDIGTAYGEALIAQLPTLHWSFSPTENVLPKKARADRREFGSGFRRPQLAEPCNTAFSMHVHRVIWDFCFQMRLYTVDYHGSRRLSDVILKSDREDIMDVIANFYKSTIKEYPRFDPYNIRNDMTCKEYIDMVDSEGDDDD